MTTGLARTQVCCGGSEADVFHVLVEHPCELSDIVEGQRHRSEVFIHLSHSTACRQTGTDPRAKLGSGDWTVQQKTKTTEKRKPKDQRLNGSKRQGKQRLHGVQELDTRKRGAWADGVCKSVNSVYHTSMYLVHTNTKVNAPTVRKGGRGYYKHTHI